jgi:hypothetical protein
MTQVAEHAVADRPPATMIAGAPPIYDGRMNLTEAPPLAQQDLEH